MNRRDLDQLLELWARWAIAGYSNGRGSSFASVLEMMMVTRCQFSGGGGAPNDAVETSVEGVVALLKIQDELSARVLRIEYGVKRFRSNPQTQLGKSAAMGITLIRYRRKLEKARRFVAEYLAKRLGIRCGY